MNDNGYLAPLEHDAMNQDTSINTAPINYDGNFNQTTSSYGQTFVYNAQNQLVDGTMQATYDGLGRCVRRTVSGVTTLFTYDDWNPVTEWDGAGNWRGWTIYGAKADEVLLRYDAIYGPQVYKHDNQGSVTFILDGPTHVAEKYSYDVYGRPTIMDGAGNVRGQSAIGNRYMYTGREWIADLQLYDYRHRFYNPDTGRFLQTDPTGFDAGDMNLFCYCGDDPVDRSDPMGLVWESERFEFVRDYSNIPNVYVTRAFNPGATGVTLQRFWIDAHVVQQGGRYALAFDDIQIRSHSYIRTYQPPIITNPGRNLSLGEVWKTTGHEARQQGIDRGLYEPLKRDVRADVTRGNYESPNAAVAALEKKNERWKAQLVDRRKPLGRELQRQDANPPMFSEAGSSPSGESGSINPQPFANAMAMATGPLEGEGIHPGGPR